MAFISISKCFNISPHLRWFMAFIRGHERLAFLWFRDLISAWHIQRLNRVLRSHFLRTPSAQPGLEIWATIIQDMLYSLSRWLRGIFAPRWLTRWRRWKYSGDESWHLAPRFTHATSAHSCPWERFESLFEREMGRGRRNYHRGKSPFFGRLFISCAGGAKNICCRMLDFNLI